MCWSSALASIIFSPSSLVALPHDPPRHLFATRHGHRIDGYLLTYLTLVLYGRVLVMLSCGTVPVALHSPDTVGMARCDAVQMPGLGCRVPPLQRENQWSGPTATTAGPSIAGNTWQPSVWVRRVPADS